MKPSFKILGVFLVFGMASSAFAELSPAAPASGAQGAATSPAPVPRGIKVFDDRVFELSRDTQPAGTTKSPVTGQQRYLGEEPDYNYVQRDQWLQTCAPLRDQDSKEYRDCFNREKGKTMSDVLTRLNEGVRTVAPERDQIPLLEDTQRREPAFGGVNVERK